MGDWMDGCMYHTRNFCFAVVDFLEKYIVLFNSVLIASPLQAGYQLGTVLAVLLSQLVKWNPS